jgi:pimeloyl-ACP methyl ester carboxylesterase
LTTTPADGEDGSFHRILTSDGLPLATWRLPVLSGAAVQEQTETTTKARTELVFAHATGFCGACWRPVRSGLGEFASTIFDFRGHGSSYSNRDVRSWWEMAQDVLAVAGGISTVGGEAPALVGIGHSMGGASLVMAELLNPGTFAAFVLVEPIVYGSAVHPRPESSPRRSGPETTRDLRVAHRRPSCLRPEAAIFGMASGGARRLRSRGFRR